MAKAAVPATVVVESMMALALALLFDDRSNGWDVCCCVIGDDAK